MKNKQIKVNETDITVIRHIGQDYISLTDMLKAKDGNFFIEHWLRNRSTIDFVGLWEVLNNPHFNSIEFDGIKKHQCITRQTRLATKPAAGEIK
jgi:hypothetical protein